MRTIAIAVMICLSMTATTAGAHGIGDCSLDLPQEIRIDPDLIRIAAKDDSELIVKSDHTVYLRGKRLAISDSQRPLVREYDAHIREMVPVIIDITLEGVEIGLTTAAQVLHALTNSEPPDELVEALKNISEDVAMRMRRDEDVYYVKGGDISGLADVMAELKPEIESAIRDSVGEMIKGTGRAIVREEGSFLDAVTSFGNRMARYSTEVERNVSKRVQTLEVQADELCLEARELDQVESDLQEEFPALRSFDLVRNDYDD